MRWLRSGLWRLFGVFSKERRDRELAAELEGHLEMHIADNRRAGMTPEEARRQALIKLGGVEQTKEEYRDRRGLPRLEQFLQDLRLGLRMLAKTPGFTTVAVVTLALGIGATTAIFSLVDAALLHAAPFPEPERLVMVWTNNPKRDWRHFPASLPDFMDWKQSGIFEQLTAFEGSGFNLRIGERTERVLGLSITQGAFQAFGAKPRLGRLFEDADMRAGHDHVVILSNALWSSHFAADPKIIGENVVLDGSPYTIIGVLPKSFPKLDQEQLYAPLVPEASVASDRGTRSWSVVGRIAPGISLAAARQRIASLGLREARQYPKDDAGNTVELQPFKEAAVEDVQPLLLLLLAVVGFVMLIACANVASLLVARGARRQRELAIRAALGASRLRLVRLLITESVLLSLAGGLVGLLPAFWGVDFIASFGLEGLPDRSQVIINGEVLVFSLALSLVTAVLFGMAPALQVWKTDLNETLKKATASQVRGPRQRLRSVLVVGEVALTMVLLAGAGLMLQTFFRLRAAFPGYDARGVISMRIALSSRQYAEPGNQAAFFDKVLRRVNALPGVSLAGACDELPSNDAFHGSGLRFADRPEPKPSELQLVLQDTATPDYFSAMRIPLIRGRYFLESDRKSTPLVAIVDERAAKRHWPNEDAVGKRIKLGSKEPWLEIVGVVGAVKRPLLAFLGRGDVGQVYMPLEQYPRPAMSLAVRTEGDPRALVAAIRGVVRDVDADQPVFQIRTLEESLATGMAPQRLAALLLGGFALVALLLAMIGIYGVVAYSAAQRTREIGLRMALGANRKDVLELVLGQGVLLMLIGVGLGLAGALALTRLMHSLLYGVGPTDLPTFVCVSLLLGAAVLLASYIPARQAMKVDPLVALRCE
jgi:predicted permease